MVDIKPKLRFKPQDIGNFGTLSHETWGISDTMIPTMGALTPHIINGILDRDVHQGMLTQQKEW